MTPEFSRMADIRNLPAGSLRLEASAEERAALAERIAIVAVERLEADVTMLRTGSLVDVTGRISADVTQQCAVSDEPFAVHVSAPIKLRFVQGLTSHKPDEELEIDAEACDEIEFEGTQFDLGEQIAQTLALAIDPYATGPEADRVRTETGLGDQASSGPFAALAALRK